MGPEESLLRLGESKGARLEVQGGVRPGSYLEVKSLNLLFLYQIWSFVVVPYFQVFGRLGFAQERGWFVPFTLSR